MAGTTEREPHRMPMGGPPVPRATLLLIDDDPELASVLQGWLEPDGYRLVHAAAGHTALELLARLQPDLILLDLKLPDFDGLVLCGELRQRSAAPIIICSGTERKRDATLGFRLGADDFIAKPFDLYTLEARIAALLRRTGTGPPRAGAPEVDVYKVGALIMDRHRRQVRVGEEELHLTPSEYRLLTALAAQPDQVLSREALALQVWGYQDPAEGRSIDVHIRRLRVKLQATATPAPAIIGVRGLGYKLASSRLHPV
jgi:DNA-binding response OmpR family regulator